jgi:hypothetical protein
MDLHLEVETNVLEEMRKLYSVGRVYELLEIGLLLW